MNDLKKICKILEETKTIAVVGISRNPNRTSRNIAEFLVDKGYNVIGVNPCANGESFDGIPVYSSLIEIQEPIDIVDVFRKSEDIPQIVPNVLEVKPKVLWLQQGIYNDEAVKPAMEKGIEVIQDSCIAVMYSLCKSKSN
ncbi:MAG: CoA-binding protein [Melioribacteraceae bacterium]|nr:CoA-binding protein [Melioribacteraceae bacterium]